MCMFVCWQKGLGRVPWKKGWICLGKTSKKLCFPGTGSCRPGSPRRGDRATFVLVLGSVLLQTPGEEIKGSLSLGWEDIE